jgi:hypothetical protein
MFEPNSRYYFTPQNTYTNENGEEIKHLRRRILPQGDQQPLLTNISPLEGDRLDLIAHRTLGDPLAFWRICDANNTMHPGVLLGFWRSTGAADPEHLGKQLDTPEETLRIPIPQVNG